MGAILSGWKEEVVSLNRTTIKVEWDFFFFLHSISLAFFIHPFEVLKYSLTRDITNYVFNWRKNNAQSFIHLWCHYEICQAVRLILNLLVRAEKSQFKKQMLIFLMSYSGITQYERWYVSKVSGQVQMQVKSHEFFPFCTTFTILSHTVTEVKQPMREVDSVLHHPVARFKIFGFVSTILYSAPLDDVSKPLTLLPCTPRFGHHATTIRYLSAIMWDQTLFMLE